MKDDISDIKAMYNAGLEREDNRLVRHQLEHELTWRYLDKYLPAQGTILEIGAATGWYTLELARRGYTVTVVDLSERLTHYNRKQVEQAGFMEKVGHVVGDARDLSVAGDEMFDAALVMGPLYHLIFESDRRAVLRQVFGLLKPDGMVFTAFISRLGLWGDILKRQPNLIENQAEIRSVVESGYNVTNDRVSGGFRGYFATVEEITPLHESIGFETVAMAGVEPAIGVDDAIYNSLTGSRRSLWLDLLEEISDSPSIVGASRHILYIGRKPGSI